MLGGKPNPGHGGGTSSTLELSPGCPYSNVKPKTLELNTWLVPSSHLVLPFKGTWSPEQGR